jgi:hypothetical protein
LPIISLCVVLWSSGQLIAGAVGLGAFGEVVVAGLFCGPADKFTDALDEVLVDDGGDVVVKGVELGGSTVVVVICAIGAAVLVL